MEDTPVEDIQKRNNNQIELEKVQELKQEDIAMPIYA